MVMTAQTISAWPDAVDFVDELYAAAIDTSRLAGALELFAGMVEAEAACLLIKDFTVGGARTRLYERSSRGSQRREHAVMLDDALIESITVEILPGQERVVCGRASPESSSAQLGARNLPAQVCFMAATVKGGPWLSFALVAMRRRNPFPDAARHQAEAALPDIRRALNLRQLAEKPDESVALRLRDETPIAVMTLRGKTVEQANAAARTLLETGEVVSIVEGELRFVEKRANAALDAMTRPGARARGGAERRASSLVMRAGGDAWLVQLAEAERGAETRLAVRTLTPALVVVLTQFDAASRSRKAMLNGFGNLTPTERQILSAFVDGRGISAIATATNRSVETVRWHVRNLFKKLGVNTQADLTRLGALLLPI